MRARITGFSALSLAAMLLPIIANAQFLTLDNTLNTLSNLLARVMWLFVAMAVVVFFWGLVVYLTKKGDEMAKEGIQLMFWGIVAIFIMVSIWGIIRLLQGTFGVGGIQPPITPSTVPSPTTLFHI